jgi:hypothetical protein
MAKLNPRRRAAKRARKEAQSLAITARALSVPEVRGWKSASVVHRDTLQGASHTPGFTGAGRSAGRATVILSEEGNMAKSMVPEHTGFRSLHGRPISPDVPAALRAELERVDTNPRALYVKGRKSKRFNRDGF